MDLAVNVSAILVAAVHPVTLIVVALQVVTELAFRPVL
jgi:hypothetical protein